MNHCDVFGGQSEFNGALLSVVKIGAEVEIKISLGEIRFSFTHQNVTEFAKSPFGVFGVGDRSELSLPSHLVGGQVDSERLRFWPAIHRDLQTVFSLGTDHTRLGRAFDWKRRNNDRRTDTESVPRHCEVLFAALEGDQFVAA